MSGRVTRTEVRFPSGAETLAGDLVLPAGDGPHPALLTVAGTGPQNRYGDQVRPDGTVEPHPRHRWVGDRLAAAGIAQLCWDKRGVQGSTGGPRAAGDPPGDRDAYTSPLTDVDDLLAALAYLDGHPAIDSRRITVMGTSAGVYFACLAAARTTIPAGYILWGGVHLPIAELAKAIYDLPLDYAARGKREHDWLLANNPGYYDLARQWPNELAAALAGRDVYEWEDERGSHTIYLERLKQEIRFAYPEQFANIRTPVMVIHGDRDLNVDVSEAHAAAAALRAAGNPDVTLAIIPGADHGMHVAPADLPEDERMRDRLKRHRDDPYSEYFIGSVIGWIRDTWVRYPSGTRAG
ncbi:MAG TPA: prolyl oligopeptidase family serine peptidase [Candidatus Limnocylindrales bacterium]|nr:prolyl oligopeptidase family serine peptidase [Candidatus Limnocylindrales bacterium]